ncbi:MAG: hypothetical protein QXY45_00520 [Candidatus Aenigmatarchaeota archaeon]
MTTIREAMERAKGELEGHTFKVDIRSYWNDYTLHVRVIGVRDNGIYNQVECSLKGDFRRCNIGSGALESLERVVALELWPHPSSYQGIMEPGKPLKKPYYSLRYRGVEEEGSDPRRLLEDFFREYPGAFF